jgi:hypothetical protein
MPSALIEHRVKDVGRRLAYLRELRDGLRFVRNSALVLSMVLVATVTNFLDVPLLTVVTVTILAMAVVYLAVTLGMFLRPALRQMDLPAPR